MTGRAGKRLLKSYRKHLNKFNGFRASLLAATLIVAAGPIQGVASTPTPPQIIATTPNTQLVALTPEIVEAVEPKATIEVASTSPYLEERKAVQAAAIKKQRAVAAVLPAVTNNSSAVELMTLAGIPQDQWSYVDFIINHEAGWNGTLKSNYAGSGAYGICQALPGSKMASAGADWRTSTLTQLKWCNGYAVARYGSWEGAYRFWTANRWW